MEIVIPRTSAITLLPSLRILTTVSGEGKLKENAARPFDVRRNSGARALAELTPLPMVAVPLPTVTICGLTAPLNPAAGAAALPATGTPLRVAFDPGMTLTTTSCPCKLTL